MDRDDRRSLLSMQEDIDKALDALQMGDADKFHALMRIVASIAGSLSEPRDPRAPIAEATAHNHT